MNMRLPTSVAVGFLSLGLAIAAAQAQSSGGGSSGGASSGGASSGSGGGPAAKSGTARRSGTSTGTSGTAAPNPSLSNNPAAQGQTAVPTPNPGSGQSASPGAATSKGDGNTPQTGEAGTRATNRGNMPDLSPNTQTQSNSPIDQSQSTQNQPLTGGGSSRREGAAGHDMRTCMATWDKGTHITKVRWREICARTLREQQAVRQEAERTVPRR